MAFPCPHLFCYSITYSSMRIPSLSHPCPFCLCKFIPSTISCCTFPVHYILSHAHSEPYLTHPFSLLIQPYCPLSPLHTFSPSLRNLHPICAFFFLLSFVCFLLPSIPHFLGHYFIPSFNHFLIFLLLSSLPLILFF